MDGTFSPGERNNLTVDLQDIIVIEHSELVLLDGHGFSVPVRKLDHPVSIVGVGLSRCFLGGLNLRYRLFRLLLDNWFSCRYLFFSGRLLNGFDFGLRNGLSRLLFFDYRLGSWGLLFGSRLFFLLVRKGVFSFSWCSVRHTKI